MIIRILSICLLIYGEISLAQASGTSPLFNDVPRDACTALKVFTQALTDSTNPKKQQAAAEAIAQMVFKARLTGEAYKPADHDYKFRVESSEEDKEIVRQALRGLGGFMSRTPGLTLALKNYVDSNYKTSTAPAKSPHAQICYDLITEAAAPVALSKQPLKEEVVLLPPSPENKQLSAVLGGAYKDLDRLIKDAIMTLSSSSPAVKKYIEMIKNKNKSGFDLKPLIEANIPYVSWDAQQIIDHLCEDKSPPGQVYKIHFTKYHPIRIYSQPVTNVAAPQVKTFLNQAQQALSKTLYSSNSVIQALNKGTDESIDAACELLAPLAKKYDLAALTALEYLAKTTEGQIWIRLQALKLEALRSKAEEAHIQFKELKPKVPEILNILKPSSHFKDVVSLLGKASPATDWDSVIEALYKAIKNKDDPLIAANALNIIDDTEAGKKIFGTKYPGKYISETTQPVVLDNIRFVQLQEMKEKVIQQLSGQGEIYDEVLEELKTGNKVSHHYAEQLISLVVVQKDAQAWEALNNLYQTYSGKQYIESTLLGSRLLENKGQPKTWEGLQAYVDQNMKKKLDVSPPHYSTAQPTPRSTGVKKVLNGQGITLTPQEIGDFITSFKEAKAEDPSNSSTYDGAIEAVRSGKILDSIAEGSPLDHLWSASLAGYSLSASEAFLNFLNKHGHEFRVLTQVWESYGDSFKGLFINEAQQKIKDIRNTPRSTGVKKVLNGQGITLTPQEIGDFITSFKEAKAEDPSNSSTYDRAIEAVRSGKILDSTAEGSPLAHLWSVSVAGYSLSASEAFLNFLNKHGDEFEVLTKERKPPYYGTMKDMFIYDAQQTINDIKHRDKITQKLLPFIKKGLENWDKTVKDLGFNKGSQHIPYGTPFWHFGQAYTELTQYAGTPAAGTYAIVWAIREGLGALLFKDYGDTHKNREAEILRPLILQLLEEVWKDPEGKFVVELDIIVSASVIADPSKDLWELHGRHYPTFTDFYKAIKAELNQG